MLANTSQIYTLLGITGQTSQEDRAMVAALQPMVERAMKRFAGQEFEQNTYTELLPHATRIDIDYDMATYDVVGQKAVPILAGSRNLQLKNLPVRSIVSVNEDPSAYAGHNPGAFGAGSLLTEGVHFFQDTDEMPNGMSICRSGQLIRVGTWPTTARCVKVVYVAGYSAAELAGDANTGIDASDLTDLVIEQMAFELSRWKARQAAIKNGSVGTIVGEKIGDYQVQYDGKSAMQAMKINLLDSVMDGLSKYINYATAL